jgi:hypothetical protein
MLQLENHGTFTHIYQSAVSLLVTDFAFFDGRDGETLVKELAAVVSNFNRISSCVFKSPYTWEEVLMFNASINQAISYCCSWNEDDIPYSMLETLLQHEA